MWTRIATGVVAAVLLVLAIYLATPAVMMSAVLFCAVLACLEYERLFFKKRSLTRQLRLSFFVMFAMLAIRHAWFGLWAFFWGAFAVHCVWHVIKANAREDFKESLWGFLVEFFGYFYVIGLFGFLVPIAFFYPFGRDYLLLLFMVVSLGDTAAYFIGSRFGKKLLAPRISPNKTVEGAVGGTVVSLLASVLWLSFIWKGELEPVYVAQIVGFALIGSILAQFGDLFESILKRSQTKKDSGVFLPGHGGILDRTDGLVLAAPVFYFYLKLVVMP